MKTNPSTHARRLWNDQHALLRRLLMKDHDYAAALPVFLDHHGMVHAAKLRANVYSFQDEVLDGLTPEQLRYCSPKTPHSAVWKLWHIARIEDVTMNLLLADSDQVLHSGSWFDRLEINRVSVGNEMSDAEIAELSASHQRESAAGLSVGGGQTYPIAGATSQSGSVVAAARARSVTASVRGRRGARSDSVAARLLGRASGCQSPPHAGQSPLPGASQRNRTDAIKTSTVEGQIVTAPTPYPDVNAMLDALLENVQDILGDYFVGLYLYGSLASGDFDPLRSDIDFVVVTTDPLPEELISALEEMHRRLWVSDLKWAAKLEGTYIPQNDLRRYDPDCCAVSVRQRGPLLSGAPRK